MAAGKQLADGSEPPGAGPLELVARFHPKRPSGPESIRVRWSTGQREITQELLVDYRVDSTVSLLPRRRLAVRLDLVHPSRSTELRLTHPLLAGREHDCSIGGPASAAVSLAVLAADRIRLSPCDMVVAGTHPGTLELPFGTTGYQRVPLSVAARAPCGVSPERIVSRIPAGGKLVHPVGLIGDWRSFDGIEDVPPVSDADTKHAAGFEVIPSIRAGPFAAGGHPRLTLTFIAGSQPRVYKGRLLLRPSADARYRVAVPYTVAVIDLE